MTVYNINLGIGWASSGVEYAQAYRAKIQEMDKRQNLSLWISFLEIISSIWRARLVLQTTKSSGSIAILQMLKFGTIDYSLAEIEAIYRQLERKEVAGQSHSLPLSTRWYGGGM